MTTKKQPTEKPNERNLPIVEVMRLVVAADDEQTAEIAARRSWGPWAAQSADEHAGYLKRFRALVEKDPELALAEHEDWKQLPVDVSAFPLTAKCAVRDARIGYAVELLHQNEKASREPLNRFDREVAYLLLLAAGGRYPEPGPAFRAALDEIDAQLTSVGCSTEIEEALEEGPYSPSGGLKSGVLALVARVLKETVSVVRLASLKWQKRATKPRDHDSLN